MKIYSEYKNYQDYVDIQTETNKIKIGVTWVMPQEIESLCEYIVREVQLNNSSTNNHVMCHGARNGIEVEYFKKNLNDNWIVEGNDISETASDYGLYQWDMQDYNKDWKRKFNIKEVSIIFTDRVRGKSKMNGSIISEAIFGVLKMRIKGLPNK